MSSTTKSDFHLFSDGGSSTGGMAAGAAIVLDHDTGLTSCFGVYLGTATNNEAEIIASLLGFAAIEVLSGSDPMRVSVHWVADSEYLLKSATGYIFNWQRNGWKTADKKPVKNQGLWQAYLTLTSRMTITSEHVRGHTGHIENESCDDVVRWLKAEGEDLCLRSSFCHAEISTHLGEGSWIVVDGRNVIEGLRQDRPDESVQLKLVSLLREALSHEAKGFQPPVSSELLMKPVLRSLREAAEFAGRSASKDPILEKAREKICSLIDELNSEL